MVSRSAIRSYSHRDFPLQRLLASKRATVSVCLPARNEARTIGRILSALAPLAQQGLVDQLVVVDNSTDGTGEIAAELGAEVYDQEELLPEIGPVLGKGDARWRQHEGMRCVAICSLYGDPDHIGHDCACDLLGRFETNPGI